MKSDSKRRRKLVLHLPLRAEYFDAIKSGEKTVEYRLCTAYWRKRIEGRDYDEIELIKGYPRKDDASRRFRRPWRGWWTEQLQHKHFGNRLVTVYCIPVNP